MVVLPEFAKQQVQPTLYSYNELKYATRDFHTDNKLGEGGFGVVYKVIICTSISAHPYMTVSMQCLKPKGTACIFVYV